jgi:hypothetical protein
MFQLLFISMGRKQKYFTKDEKTQANRDAVMKHYEKNKEKIKRRNLKRYYETVNKERFYELPTR